MTQENPLSHSGPSSLGIRTTVDECSYSTGRGYLYRMNAISQRPYAQLMAQPFECRERWSDVSAFEFEAFSPD